MPGLGEVSPRGVVALIVLALALVLVHGTGFGRSVDALGGVLFGICTLSGCGRHAQGLELDAIAATVIGGALLSGGVGYVRGTLTGVPMPGVIQTLIMFDGSLSPWWTRIAIGALLGLFARPSLRRARTCRCRAGTARHCPARGARRSSNIAESITGCA